MGGVPAEMYGWGAALTVKGYDPRQTSVYWLERQAVALKGALYRDYHGREVSGSRTISVSSPRAEYEDIDIRVYTPPEGATVTHEVWPPIDLLRLVEERRAQRQSEGIRFDTYHTPSGFSGHLPRNTGEGLDASFSSPACGGSGRSALEGGGDGTQSDTYQQAQPSGDGSPIEPCISLRELHWMSEDGRNSNASLPNEQANLLKSEFPRPDE